MTVAPTVGLERCPIAHRAAPHDHEAYKSFLQDIGYLLPEGETFQIDTAHVDAEIARIGKT